MKPHPTEIGQSNGTRKNSTISISDTFWGYVIGNGRAARKRAVMGEMAAITGCLFFGTAAFGQWLFPGAIYADLVLPLKISITIMFFVFSALLYLIARRGLTTEVQINVKRQNVRMVRRNREGGTTVMARFGFADINSIYIKRSKSDFVADQMFMKTNSGTAPVLIASGPARDLEPLLDMLQRDLRGQMPHAPSNSQKPATSAPRPRGRTAFATG